MFQECLTLSVTYWSNRFSGWQKHDKVHYVLKMAFVCCLINITELSLSPGARAAATLAWHRAPWHPFVTPCWRSVASSYGDNKNNVKYHGDAAAKQQWRHPNLTSEFMPPRLDWTCGLNVVFPWSANHSDSGTIDSRSVELTLPLIRVTDTDEWGARQINSCVIVQEPSDAHSWISVGADTVSWIFKGWRFFVGGSWNTCCYSEQNRQGYVRAVWNKSAL